MIVENAENQTANQKKGNESQNYFRTQIEQFEQSSLNLGLKQNGKFELFLSLSIRTSNAY
jgi:hypothetical protein